MQLHMHAPSLVVVVNCAVCGVFLVVVCIILLEWIYYFIVMFILFYCVEN